MHKKGSFSSPEDHVSQMAGMVYGFHTAIHSDMLNVWVVDTGASSHMCCNFSLLTNITSLTQPFLVALPNKHIISVTQVGQVVLNPHITLFNVLYIPEFHCNLLSVTKLAQDNKCTATFFADFFFFRTRLNRRSWLLVEQRMICTTYLLSMLLLFLSILQQSISCLRMFLLILFNLCLRFGILD